MVLQTDGHRFQVEGSWGLRPVSSAHVTGAPAPPARDAKCAHTLRAQALFKVGDQIKEGPELVFERFLNHGWDDEGQLKVQVEWFGFSEQGARRQFSSSLPGEAVRKHCVRKRVKLLTLTREGVLVPDKVGRRS